MLKHTSEDQFWPCMSQGTWINRQDTAKILMTISEVPSKGYLLSTFKPLKPIHSLCQGYRFELSSCDFGMEAPELYGVLRRRWLPVWSLTALGFPSASRTRLQKGAARYLRPGWYREAHPTLTEDRTQRKISVNGNFVLKSPESNKNRHDRGPVPMGR